MGQYVHLCLGSAFGALMLVHIILHWGWIKCYVKSLFSATEKQACEESSPS